MLRYPHNHSGWCSPVDMDAYGDDDDADCYEYESFQRTLGWAPAAYSIVATHVSIEFPLARQRACTHVHIPPAHTHANQPAHGAGVSTRNDTTDKACQTMSCCDIPHNKNTTEEDKDRHTEDDEESDDPVDTTLTPAPVDENFTSRQHGPDNIRMRSKRSAATAPPLNQASKYRRQGYMCRKTCHNCGNIRASLWTCNIHECGHSFCIHCVARIMEWWNTQSVFGATGCAVCQLYCCCQANSHAYVDDNVRHNNNTRSVEPALHCVRCPYKFHHTKTKTKLYTRASNRSKGPPTTTKQSTRSPVFARREPYNTWARELFDVGKK